jgi:hypothetical protein
MRCYKKKNGKKSEIVRAERVTSSNIYILASFTGCHVEQTVIGGQLVKEIDLDRAHRRVTNTRARVGDWIYTSSYVEKRWKAMDDEQFRSSYVEIVRDLKWIDSQKDRTWPADSPAVKPMRWRGAKDGKKPCEGAEGIVDDGADGILVTLGYLDWRQVDEEDLAMERIYSSKGIEIHGSADAIIENTAVFQLDEGADSTLVKFLDTIIGENGPSLPIDMLPDDGGEDTIG